MVAPFTNTMVNGLIGSQSGAERYLCFGTTISHGIQSRNSIHVDVLKFSKSGFITAPDFPSFIFFKAFCAPLTVLPEPLPAFSRIKRDVSLINSSNTGLGLKCLPLLCIKYPCSSVFQLA